MDDMDKGSKVIARGLLWMAASAGVTAVALGAAASRVESLAIAAALILLAFSQLASLVLQIVLALGFAWMANKD